MKRNRSFFSITGVLFLSLQAIAATSSSDEKPVPVETLQKKLTIHKSKGAKTIKRAYDALRSKKYAQARKLATPLQHDKIFNDYGYWIAAEATVAEAKAAIKGGRFGEAETAAKRALTLQYRIEPENPYSPFIKVLYRDISDAELSLAEAYMGEGKWPLAQSTYEKSFQRLLTAGGMSHIRPENLDHYGQTCLKVKRAGDDLCQAWLQRFVIYYPKASNEFKAITRNFEEIPDSKYSHAVAKAQQSYRAPDLDQVAFDAALAQYHDEKYGPATKSFKQFLDEYPKSAHRYRARYWVAQAQSHDQAHDRAQKLYEELQQDSPFTYYGLLAAFASGRAIDATLQEALPLAVSRDPFLHAHELFRVQRAEKLLAEGATEMAAEELREFRSRDALSSPFLMYLAMLNWQAKSYNVAFSFLGELIQRNYEGIYSNYVLKMIFPVQYYDFIKKYAAENKLDPILVMSLMKQESAFDPSANSVSGALGLMQLMPATAVDTVPEIARADLFDPETNIRVGTKYLGKLMAKFSGNTILSLAGYNAGPGAADRWLKDTPSKRGILGFIESIPYRETREYVSSILRNYFWYSKLLGQPLPRSLSFFWNIYGPVEVPILSEPAPTGPAFVAPPTASPMPEATPTATPVVTPQTPVPMPQPEAPSSGAAKPTTAKDGEL